jgi:hypothetical protein
MGRNIQVKHAHATGVFDHFIVEPFLPHAQTDEYYICKVAPQPLLMRIPLPTWDSDMNWPTTESTWERRLPSIPMNIRQDCNFRHDETKLSALQDDHYWGWRHCQLY